MPSRLKTKKLHESASSRGHFLQIVQSKLLANVTVGSHRGWYHRSAWALMHGISRALPGPTVLGRGVIGMIAFLASLVFPRLSSYYPREELRRLVNQWGRLYPFYQTRLEGNSYGSVRSQHIGKLLDL